MQARTIGSLKNAIQASIADLYLLHGVDDATFRELKRILSKISNATMPCESESSSTEKKSYPDRAHGYFIRLALEKNADFQRAILTLQKNLQESLTTQAAQEFIDTFKKATKPHKTLIKRGSFESEDGSFYTRELFDAEEKLAPNRKRKATTEIEPKSWLVKVSNTNGANSKLILMGETFSMEFHRFLQRTHPKTRLAQLFSERKESSSSTSSVVYRSSSKGVAARKLTDYENLLAYSTDEIQDNFSTHTWKGLGYILILALIFSEDDLKWSNLAVLDDHLIKLDGDGSFATLSNDRENYYFDEQDIAALPDVIKYSPDFWLSYVERGEHVDEPQFELVRTPELVQEINTCMLQVLILPDIFFQEFMASCGVNASEGTTLYDEFIHNVTLLRKAALKNSDFLTFIHHPLTKNLVTDFVKEAESFVVRENFVPGKRVFNLASQMQEKFRLLQGSPALELKSTPVIIQQALTQPKLSKLQVARNVAYLQSVTERDPSALPSGLVELGVFQNLKGREDYLNKMDSLQDLLAEDTSSTIDVRPT